MNVQLNQTLSWTGNAGAHYDVRVKNGGGSVILTRDNGSVNSVLLSDLFAGVDFATEGTFFNISVRSKLSDGSFPSAWSSELSVTVTGGFDVPTGLVVT